MGDRLLNGRYEKQEIRILKKFNKKKSISSFSVLELGGCLGVLSVIVNKMLFQKDKHVVIEANPELIPYLSFNKKHNNCFFHIENSIISNNSGTTQFMAYDKLIAESAHRMDNREKNKRIYNVKNITLNSLINKYKIIFDFMIVDIEGGELQFIKENMNYIKNNVKYLLIEIHEFLMYKNFEKICITMINNCSMDLLIKDGESFLFKNLDL